MKNITIFLSEFFYFLVVKFSVYLNRHVFLMIYPKYSGGQTCTNSINPDQTLQYKPRSDATERLALNQGLTAYHLSSSLYAHHQAVKWTCSNLRTNIVSS